ncbi:MAG: chitobiase/beta-hexosaminidase C-terminal domain-containing protein [Paludibacteraceae bacterium]|nr:chitobiase/beta-hexosaminidase C-terminal domain-containing protein [Paludibacteraceae bacterium]
MKKYLLFLLAIWMPMMAWAAAPTHTLTIKAGAKFNITVKQTDGTSLSGNVVKYDPEYIVTYSLMEGDSYSISIDPLTYENDYIYSQFTAWMRDDAFYSKSTELKLIMGKSDITLTALSTRVAEPPYSPGANSFDAVTGTLTLDEIRNAKSQGVNSAYSVAKAMYKFEDSDVLNVVVIGDLEGTDISLVGSFGKLANLASIDMSQTSGLKSLLSSYYTGSYNKLQKLEHIALGASIETINQDAFFGMTQLTAIDCYATTPPNCDPKAFDENYVSQISLRVPAGCVEQYQQANGWKELSDVTSLNEIGDITVKLPTDVPYGYYEDMTLELTNLRSKMVYPRKVLNKREFLFSGQIREAEYQATLKNAYGHVMGQTEAVELAEDKLTLTFDKLLQKKDVNVKVTTPEGEDYTNLVRIEWIDESNKIIGYASRLKAVAEGRKLICQISVGHGIAHEYVAPPATQFTVAAEGDNLLTLVLLPVEQMTLFGYVTDAETGDSISGATVAITHQQAGYTDKSIIATTGADGRYELQGTNKPGEITVSATGKLPNTVPFAAPQAGGELPTVVLEPKVDIIVKITLTYTEYTEDGTEGKVIEDYKGHSDVVYQVYNKTRKREIKNFDVLEGALFIPDGVIVGQELTITATSRSNDFIQASADCVIPKGGTGYVTVPLMQTPQGSLKATVNVPDSISVMGVLYRADGRFQRSKTYILDSLQFNDLPEGDYNLITMTSNTLLRRTLLLSTLDDMGLVEGTDYKKTPVHIERGQVTTVNVGTVPALDMEKLHYTDKSTYFMAKKSIISMYEYSYIYSQVRFAEKYAKRVSNVEVIVDMPEEIYVVENSAYDTKKWSSTISYRIENGRYIFPIKNLDDHQLSFSLRPDKAGEYEVSASVSFKLDGVQTIQPIGTAWIQVISSFTMNEPTMSEDYNNTYVKLSGTLPPAGGKVKIYDYDKFVGSADVSFGNKWKAEIQYPKDGSIHLHALKARLTDNNGSKKEETDVQYISLTNINIYAERVVMMTQRLQPITFNMVDNTVSPNNYIYVLKQYWSGNTPYHTTFNFLAYFENLDKPKEKEVKIDVLVSDGSIRTLDAKYDEHRQCFYASSDFSSIYQVPKSACAYYADDSYKPISEDEHNRLFDLDAAFVKNVSRLAVLSAKNAGTIELDTLNNQDEETLVFTYTVNGSDPMEFTAKEMDFDEAVEYVMKDSFVVNRPMVLRNDSDTLLYTLVNGLDQVELILIDMTDSVALRAVITDAEIFDPGATPNRKDADPKKALQEDIIPEFLISKGFNAGSKFLSTIGQATGLVDYMESPFQLQEMAARAHDAERRIDSWIRKINYDLEYKLCTHDKTVRRKYGGETKERYLNWLSECEREGDYLQTMIAREIANFKEDLGRKALWDLGTTVLGGGLGKAAVKSAVKLSPDAVRAVHKVERVIETQDGRMLTSELGFLGEVADGAFDIVENAEKFISLDFDRHYQEFLDQADNQEKYTITCLQNLYTEMINNNDCRNDGDDCDGEDCDPGNSSEGGDDGGDDENNEEDDDEDVKNGRNPNGKPEKVRVPRHGYRSPYTPPYEPYKKFRNLEVHPLIDPSGYVYEAVPSNRVEGATATIYYMDYMINSSGNSTGEQDVLWDAENFGQVNPQITDSTGMYQWDVPQGLWQVRVQKEGYESNQTEWLPVPPPQLDVNIPIVRNRLPKVEKAHAYEEAVTAKFDSYMLPELLNLEQIIVTENGAIVAGAIELTDAEAVPDGTTYASQFRFTPTTPFTANEVVLHISGAVQNYSGIEMDEPFEAVLPIEREVKTLVADRSVKVLYQHARVVHVKGEPAAAAAGKTVSIKSASGIIATATENTVVLNKDGEAEVLIQGDLPGVELITFNLDNPELSASTKVNVMESAPWWVDAPEASVPSETELERGATVTLSSQTEGAVIYYTLDGSNPYDSDTRIQYNGTPVVINAETTLKAIAIVEDKGRSDVRTYHYTIKVGTEIRGVNGSDISVVPVRVHDSFEVSGVEGAFSVSVYSMTGQRLILSSQVRNGQRINATALPTGVYLVVVSGDNTYSTHRIIKD